VGAEHRLVNILRPHPNLVISRAEIKLGEEPDAVELVDDGDRERILDGECVQGPVVDAEMPGAVILFDEKDR
jgi:hypothetical protein